MSAGSNFDSAYFLQVFKKPRHSALRIGHDATFRTLTTGSLRAHNHYRIRCDVTSVIVT